MSLDAQRTGEVIQAAEGELIRIWRSARSQARRGVFPGLLDGIMGDFLHRAGIALAEGRDPESVSEEIEGAVRIDPMQRGGSAMEIETEWMVAAEVLRSVCEALDADPSQAWVIGDDIESDVRGGQMHGIRTVLLRTGKFRPDSYERSRVRPTVLLSSIADLPEWLATQR